jgi:hypothetical protein
VLQSENHKNMANISLVEFLHRIHTPQRLIVDKYATTFTGFYRTAIYTFSSVYGSSHRGRKRPMHKFFSLEIYSRICSAALFPFSTVER